MTALLHGRFPALAQTLPHAALGAGPTPVRRLALPGPGADAWLKDDSQFGSGGWGGNKVRKLEWILPDARRSGRRTILTFGALATNHGLATALYAREQGLRCALALVDQPVDEHVRRQLQRIEASGAAVHRTHTKARTALAAPWLIARHRTGLRPAYVLPAGGSSPVGALGYVEASLELAEQVRAGALPEPSHAVVAVGSGGTIAGLLLGLQLAGLRTRPVGIIVNDLLKLTPPVVCRLARRSARLLERRGAKLPQLSLGPEALELSREQLGPGYGVQTPASKAALAQAHGLGIELEPVYTAKAFAAVLAGRSGGRFGAGPVLFINTHGAREAG